MSSEKLRKIYGASGEKPKTPTPVQIERKIEREKQIKQIMETTGITDGCFISNDLNDIKTNSDGRYQELLASFLNISFFFLPEIFQWHILALSEA